MIIPINKFSISHLEPILLKTCIVKWNVSTPWVTTLRTLKDAKQTLKCKFLTKKMLCNIQQHKQWWEHSTKYHMLTQGPLLTLHPKLIWWKINMIRSLIMTHRFKVWDNNCSKREVNLIIYSRNEVRAWWNQISTGFSKNIE